MEICFYLFNSFTSIKVDIVLLSQSGFLYAFLNWLEAGERKAVSGVSKLPGVEGGRCRAEIGRLSAGGNSRVP